MAQRYGGRFSPDPSGRKPDAGLPAAPAGPRPSVLRRNLLYAAPLPLVFTALSQPALGMALDFLALAALLFAAYLLGEGQKAEAAWAARTVARRPAIPRKALATLLTGFGVAVATWVTGGRIVDPIIYGLVAAALHLAAFGTDPMRDKGMDGDNAFQSERVARVVDEAEKYLSAMTTAVKPLGDWELETRVRRFEDAARVMIRTVQDDPRDLTAARKYLGVYLMGARDAARKFADLFGRTRDAQARTDFLTLLDDLEQGFAQRTQAMLKDGKADLDVEIEVLRERLARDGVNAG